jgi:hypothetical protein
MASEVVDFSDELEAWLSSDSPKTLGRLNDVFDERSFAVAIMIVMFPSALPVPTGGITHLLELVALLLALQLVVGRREIWLPRRWRERELGKSITGKAIPFVIRRVRWFERWSQPRLAGVFEQGWFRRGAGIAFAAFAVAGLVAPPFSGLDTLPALGAVLLALSIILHDVAYSIAGGIVGVSGVALIVALGRAALELFEHVL